MVWLRVKESGSDIRILGENVGLSLVGIQREGCGEEAVAVPRDLKLTSFVHNDRHSDSLSI